MHTYKPTHVHAQTFAHPLKCIHVHKHIHHELSLFHLILQLVPHLMGSLLFPFALCQAPCHPFPGNFSLSCPEATGLGGPGLVNIIGRFFIYEYCYECSWDSWLRPKPHDVTQVSAPSIQNYLLSSPMLGEMQRCLVWVSLPAAQRKL